MGDAVMTACTSVVMTLTDAGPVTKGTFGYSFFVLMTPRQ